VEEEWVAEAAEALERITHDPMADAHRGTIRILTVSDPSRRRGYQPCAMRLALEAPGLAEEMDYEGVFPRGRWPRVGTVLRARISRKTPRIIEANWDAAVG
jgi:hypothetical protein